MTRLRVGTYNIAFFLKDSLFTDDLDRLLPLVDVIGFQEFGSKGDRVNLVRAANKHGFGVFRGEDEAVPVAYRKDVFDLLDSGSHWLSPDTRVGEEGAGPSVLKKKHLVWVKLRHKPTGRIFYFGNCHLAPSVHLDIRRKLHALQTTNIKRWVENTPNNIIFVGDFNYDHRLDEKRQDPDMPYAKFGRVNVWSTFRALGEPAGGTHGGGKRLIDYVWFRNKPNRFRPVSQTILNGYDSDHKPFIAEFEVTKRFFRKRRK